MSSFYDRPGHKTQRAEWKYLQSKESSHLRGVLTRKFNQFFPKGHKTSLKSLVRRIAQRVRGGEIFADDGVLQHMNNIHPEALEIIIRYGRDYTPYIWTAAPPSPKKGFCFGNSWILARADEQCSEKRNDKAPLLYVEGIVFGSIVRPMLHAWNVRGLNGKTAIDWTHFPISHWSRYLGIPFTLEEHREIRRLTPLGENVHLLFHKKYFTDRAKARLISILKKRN